MVSVADEKADADENSSSSGVMHRCGQPAENASFHQNVSYVCPEPVLAEMLCLV
jgi:hypothetical protein